MHHTNGKAGFRALKQRLPWLSRSDARWQTRGPIGSTSISWRFPRICISDGGGGGGAAGGAGCPGCAAAAPAAARGGLVSLRRYLLRLDWSRHHGRPGDGSTVTPAQPRCMAQPLLQRRRARFAWHNTRPVDLDRASKKKREDRRPEFENR